MSRTDDLRGKGARDRTGGGGGGAPFVRWGDEYEWIEGTVESVWQTQYGAAIELKITATSTGVQTEGKDEDGRKVQGRVRVGEEVNIGLNNKMLEGAITQEDLGGQFHVAFEGWQEPKKAGANRYRVFTVLDITRKHEQPAARSAEGIEPWPDDEEVPADTGARAGSAPDDDLPFAPLRLTEPWF